MIEINEDSRILVEGNEDIIAKDLVSSIRQDLTSLSSLVTKLHSENERLKSTHNE